MKQRFLIGALTAATLAASGGAMAADFGVGVKAGTLGAGVELGMSLTDSISARAGLNSYSLSDSRTEDGIKYDGDFDLRSTALLLDWHPFTGIFRMTAGYVFNSNKLELTGKLDDAETYVIGDASYTGAELGQLNGTVDMGSGPYIGVGWGNVPAKGLGFTFDIGVFQQGSPDVSLVATDPLNVIDDAELREEEGQLESDLSEFEVYPVVSLGLSYGF
jgi:hypothetical protein